MKSNKNNTQIKIVKANYGFAPLSHNIARNNKLTDGAKTIYIYLNSLAENFYISNRQLAINLNKSLNYVITHIKELKQSGFIEIERNGNNFIYKIYTEPLNEEYKLKEMLNKNQLDFTDIETIYKILNNQKISQETRKQINEKLKKILKANWLDNDY